MPDGITAHAGLTMALTEPCKPGGRVMSASPLPMYATGVTTTMDTTDMLTSRTGTAAVAKK